MKQSLKQVLLPTINQALGCLAASVVLIVVLYRDQILQRISHGSGAAALGQIHYGDALAGVSNSPIVHTTVIVAFWSAIGLVAYTLVWSLINVMIEARNEVVLETEYTNKSALADRIKTPLAQLALAVVLFTGLVTAAKLIFPFLLGLSDTATRTSSIVMTITYAVLSIGGTALTMYLLLLLGQLVFWLG